MFAQNKDMLKRKKEQMEAMKVGYITKEFPTTEEAQAFWPVYNEYNSHLNKLRVERRVKKA